MTSCRFKTTSMCQILNVFFYEDLNRCSFLRPFERDLSLTFNRLISVWIFVVCCISTVALPAAISAVCVRMCFETLFLLLMKIQIKKTDSSLFTVIKLSRYDLWRIEQEGLQRRRKTRGKNNMITSFFCPKSFSVYSVNQEISVYS